MPRSTLDPLQERVLIALAGTEPAWTLTGGGALAGVHFGHRATRDLDLFFRDRRSLDRIKDVIRARLVDAGLEVAELHGSPSFQQLRVSTSTGVVILDLVADPVPTIDIPMNVALGAVTMQVDTPHEIFVNKLCALLGRAELRDLIDVQALLAHGLDLAQAVQDAPRKDLGFSPLTLCWVLQQQNVDAMARIAGVDAERAAELSVFRNELVERVLALTKPT